MPSAGMRGPAANPVLRLISVTSSRAARARNAVRNGLEAHMNPGTASSGGACAHACRRQFAQAFQRLSQADSCAAFSWWNASDGSNMLMLGTGSARKLPAPLAARWSPTSM